MAEQLVAAWSESQVAGRMGVARKSVSNWRKGGPISEPKLKALKRLFRELEGSSAGASRVIPLPSRTPCDQGRTEVAVSVAPPPATTPVFNVRERNLRAEILRQEIEVERLEEVVAATPGSKAPRHLAASLIGIGLLETFMGAGGILNVYGESIVTALVVGAGVAACLLTLTAALGRSCYPWLSDRPWAGWAWRWTCAAAFASLAGVAIYTQYGAGVVDAAIEPMGLDMPEITVAPTGNVLFPFYVLGLLIFSGISMRLNYLAAGPAAQLQRERKQLMRLELQAEKGAKS